MSKSKRKRKLLISVMVMIVVISSTVALTLAYRTDITNVVVNEFETPVIDTAIEETFNGVTKTNVTVTNSVDSDVDVYARVKFVVQTLEAVLDSYGNPVMQNEYGIDVYVIYNENGTISGYSLTDDGIPDSGLSYTTLTYKTGAIVATPTSYGDDGYLLNLPINIVNDFEIGGLNVDFTGNGNADWFTDANQETGIYFYKYSLAPGESAYDLITDIKQEVFYEDTIIRLTVLVDSVQVDGVEDAWVNVNQSGNNILLDGQYVGDTSADTVSVAYLDANGNPILYSSTYDQATDATGVPPIASYTSYIQRFIGADEDVNNEDDYEETQGYNSYGISLTTDETMPVGTIE